MVTTNEVKMFGENVAFGMIVPSLNSPSPVIDFLNNAAKHDHQVSQIIVCYKDEISETVQKKISQLCKLTLIKRGEIDTLADQMLDLGLSKNEIEQLIGTPCLEEYGLVSYGTSRNYVLISALLKGIDYLFFFDSDIYPKILTDKHKSDYCFQEIDFIDSHLRYLRSSNDIVATTSDYTGYYIIPRMNFPGLRKLLYGLQKEDRYYYITSVDTPVMRDCIHKNIFNTRKLLGGNLALNLKKIDLIPPFYSSTLKLNNQCYLGRGEDTLFGPIITSLGGRCIDIDMLVFHDCFHDFPEQPDISKSSNVDRFFYACAGWLIRNPFFNWIRKQHNIESESYNYRDRLEALKKGSKAAVEYFEDERFEILPAIYIKAHRELENEIKRFKKVIKIWQKFTTNIKKRGQK